MYSNLRKRFFSALVSSISLTIVTFSGCFGVRQATADDDVSFAPPQPPSDLADPGQRTAAAARGSCGATDKGISSGKENPLTALAPFYNSGRFKLVWGETIVSRPTLWFYIPRLANVPKEFVLQDEIGRTIYKGPVELTRTAKVVGLPFPSAVRPLAVGKRYHWFFDLYCQREGPPVYVEGWVQRQNLNPVLKQRLNKATAKQRVALFAAQGLWYDALSTSIELRKTNPRDTSWNNLLRSVGLSNISLEPISNPSSTQKVSMSLP